MSFAQTEYLPFLVLLVLAFPFVPRRARVLGMLLASYGFYFGQPPIHLAVLVGSTLLDFFVGLALGRVDRVGLRRALLYLSLAGNLGALIAFKYSPLFRDPPHWALPLGISFYTFQTIGYTIDVYTRRIEPCRKLVDFALFVAFFPQLIAGPIEKSSHLLPQLARVKPVTLANLSLGSRLILWGVFKKACLADVASGMSMEQLNAPQGHDSLTLFLNCYMMLALLYLDFSAYTDIARGTARLFGISLVKNFRAPFAATSIVDFTRRWHVSLMHWIEEYLYMPLMRGRQTHFKIWRTNILLIGLLGLWHGPYLSYVFFGGLLGCFISIQQSMRLRLYNKGQRAKPSGRAKLVAGWWSSVTCWAFFVVALYAGGTVGTLEYFKALFTGGLPATADVGQMSYALVFLGVCLAGHLVGHRMDLDELWRKLPTALKGTFFLVLISALIQFGDGPAQAFVYFRF